ncbi:hypothetical protein MXB_4145, partial [Myxobolus squamalis]
MRTLFSELKKYKCLLKPSEDVSDFFFDVRNGFIRIVEMDLLMKLSIAIVDILNEASCCNPLNCNFLQTDYQCSIGECCKNCKFQPNKVCRNSVGECDLAERCNADYHECPVEKIKKNFELCSN